MKYTLEIDIDVPKARVLELFDNADNLAKWQPGLIGMEHLSGDFGEVGSTYKLRYEMGKREIEMIETITERTAEGNFSATYEAKGVWNLVENRFVEIEGDRTRWVTHNEFRCTGMMRVWEVLFPGVFKKESQKYLKLFKDFAEQA